MLPLSLSYDHRVIDGADGARFLRWVAEAFEQPFMMSLHVVTDCRAAGPKAAVAATATTSRARPPTLCPASTQLVVIGAGPAATPPRSTPPISACRSRSSIPSPNPGGVCLYRGCIPSKALLHVAEIVNEAKHAEAWGVTFGAPTIDVDKVRAFKDKVVDAADRRRRPGREAAQDHYIQGTAAFRDATSLEITEGRRRRRRRSPFEHAVIATGSRPATVPGVSIDSPRVMDSTAALDLPDIPKSLLVVGGGYIGLELGTVYAALGSKVTVVEMTDGLLPGADRDLVNILAKRIDVDLRGGPARTRRSRRSRTAKDGVDGDVRGPAARGHGRTSSTFDRVLVSVGRRPNSAVPGLDKTRVKVNQRGFIEVDGRARTAEPTIYAIGDVVGEPMLAHKASHEARVAIDSILGERVAFEPRGDSGGRLHRSRSWRGAA